MCRCKYPKFIDKNKINITEDKKSDRCYKISFNLGARGNDVLIISRAPKRIEDNSCDIFYKRIIKFLERKKEVIKGIRRITIVNLFTSYRYSKENFYEECLLNEQAFINEGRDIIINNKIIEEEIENADYIIAAWGEPLGKCSEVYANRIEYVLKALRNVRVNALEKKHVLKVGEVSTKGYPKHCLAWSYKDDLQELFE